MPPTTTTSRTTPKAMTLAYTPLATPVSGYVPKNPSIYEAAYVGAFAGMAAGRPLDNPSPSFYAQDSLTALRWAQLVDTAVAAVLGSGAPLTRVQADLARQQSYGQFEGRQMIGQEDFTGEPEATAAFITAGISTFAGAYSGTPSPTPGPGPTPTPVTAATPGLGAILVFQPGATYSTTSPQPSNVFTDFPSLLAALPALGSEATVRVDSSFATNGIAIIPGGLGTLNLGYGVTFEPANTDLDTNNNAIIGPADTLEIGPGTTLVGFRGIDGPLELQSQCTAGPAITMMAGDAYTLTNGASLVLLPASTSPLAQCAPPSSSTASTAPTFTLIADGLVSVQSEAAGVPVFGLGYALTSGGPVTPSAMTVFASRTLSVQGLVFGGSGTVYFNFDASCSPLFAGPNQPVSTASSLSSGPPVSAGVTIVNALQSQIPQSKLVFNPSFSSATRWVSYGPVCSTWDQVMAWVTCQNNLVTDITIAIAPGASYTLTADTVGQPYVLSGITLHAGNPSAGTLVLADGVVLQDLARITDDLDVEVVAATTTPFTFSTPGASFSIDGEATLSFAPPTATPSSSPATGTVPAINITGALSPFYLAVSTGGSLDNAAASAPLVQLADAKAIVNVTATGGDTTSGPVFSGTVFAGPVGSQLSLANDATVSPPSLTAFLGTFTDVRLTLGANVRPAAGLASAAPASALVGALYYATDLQTLCICVGPGSWASSNVTTGTAALIPKAGVIGQLYYAADTQMLSVWSGSAWAPLSTDATVGVAASMPTAGAAGQLYYAPDTKVLSVWSGSAWIPLMTSATIGAAAAIPKSGFPGQLYFATDTQQLSIWTGTAWTPLTSSSSLGTAAAAPKTGVLGQLYYATDTKLLSVWSGTAWTQLSAPQTQIVFDPTGTLASQPPGYGLVCSTWAQLVAWMQLNPGAVTDITVPIPGGTTYTLTPETAGQPYSLAGVTLHGAAAPNNGTLVLADGLVLQDLAGIADGLTVQAIAATTVPLTFSSPGATFSIDGANLAFVANPPPPAPIAAPTATTHSSKHSSHHHHSTKHTAQAAPVQTAPAEAQTPTTTDGPPANGTVPVIAVSGALSPFALTITNGAVLTNVNGSSGLVALTDETAVVRVLATGEQAAPTLSGTVFSGVQGSQLTFSHDASVAAPSFASFGGTSIDNRLAMASSLLPSTGSSTSPPANGVVGDTYYATDIQTLCVCVAPGQWQSTNASVGDSTTVPAAGVLGQFFYATDTNCLSIWNGSTWIPMGLTSGLASDLPDSAAQGQMYLQTDSNKLSVFNNGQWMSAKLHVSP